MAKSSDCSKKKSGGGKKKNPVAAPPDGGGGSSKKQKKANRRLQGGKKTKKRSSSAGPGGGAGKGKSSSRGGSSKRSRNPVSAVGPFNVQPITKRQQSRQDQKKAGTYGRIKGKSKYSRNHHNANPHNDAHTPHKAFPHGQRAPKYKMGRHAEHNFAPRRGGRNIPMQKAGQRARKGKPFVVHLPPEHSAPKWTDVPWYDETLMGDNAVGSYSGDSAAKNSARKVPALPTTGISEDALCRLDAELNAFANYVRLSSVETDARSYVVNHVRDLAMEIFGNGKNGGNNIVNSAGRKRRRRLDTWSDHEGDEDDMKRKGGNDDDDEDGIRVVCFGSFAAPEVCTFLSDVDLALWGVVPPLDPLDGGGGGTHTRFGQDDEDTSSVDDEAPKMSQSALQRTMDALDAAQTARDIDMSKSAPQDKEERVQRWRDALAAGDTSNDFPAVGDGQPASGDGTEALFMIDREGEFDSNEMPDATSDGSSADAKSKVQSSEQEEKKGEAAGTNKAKGSNFLFVVDRDGAKEFGHDEEGAEEPATQIPGDTISSQKDSKDAATETSAASTEDGVNTAIDLTASPRADDASEQVGEPSEEHTRDEGIEDSERKEIIEINDDDDDDEARGESDDESTNRNDASVSDYDDDDDDADKMEGFRQDRQKSESSAVSDSKQQYVVDLLSDSSNSDDDGDDAVQDRLRQFMAADLGGIDEDEDDVEVSLVVPGGGAIIATNSQQARPSIGQTGKTKEKVVSALKRLGKKLWASKLTDTVEVRRHAKVPIVTCSTRLGFDGDVAIAGHSGADTSKYASSQVSRYESFAPVVLLLKIILYQTELDKPFTGGLGSYKLYVLVAHHLDQHVALGGSDRPAEVFASFLYRYGAIKGYQQRCHENSVTTLGQTTTLTSQDNGHADMMPVFHVSHCVEVFEKCFWRLMKRLQRRSSGGPSSKKDSSSGPSLLGNLVNCTKLKVERKACLAKAERVHDLTKEEPFIGRNHPGKVNAGRKVGHVFSREGRSFNAGTGSPAPKSKSGRTTPQRRGDGMRDPYDTDEEADRLMAGYGVMRGPRGSLVPKHRPDVEARREALRNDPDHELKGRASKNRSSKKKQKRDSAVREFAMGKI